jgi:hypothetical protein
MYVYYPYICAHRLLSSHQTDDRPTWNNTVLQRTTIGLEQKRTIFYPTSVSL